MPKLLFCAVSVFLLLMLGACGAGESEKVAEQPPPAETPEAAPTPAPEASEAEAGGALNVDEQGRALRGFDAVAYHTDGAAVAGAAEFSHAWQGATWLFANAENRDAFVAAPERYAPMNGGYCTFGVVLGKKLDVDPERFLVQNEDLYLFLNAEVQEKFAADVDGNLSLVTENWPLIADKHPEELAVGEAG